MSYWTRCHPRADVALYNIGSGPLTSAATPNWEFPEIRGTSFWDPENKDPNLSGTTLGSPIFGDSQISPSCLLRLALDPTSPHRRIPAPTGNSHP